MQSLRQTALKLLPIHASYNGIFPVELGQNLLCSLRDALPVSLSHKASVVQVKDLLFIPECIQQLFRLRYRQIHPRGQLLRLRKAAALLVHHLFQYLDVCARFFQAQRLDHRLLAPLVLVSCRIQHGSSSEGFHRRIEADNKFVISLNTDWLVEAKLNKGLLPRLDCVGI